MIVFVAALGTFAVRLHTDDRQIGILQLLQYRAKAAAQAGVEYAAARLANAGAGASCLDVQTTPINLDGHVGFRGFTVTVQCDSIEAGVRVFEIRATARSGAFGSPDYVVSRITRRMAPASGVYE